MRAVAIHVCLPVPWKKKYRDSEESVEGKTTVIAGPSGVGNHPLLIF